MGNEFNQRDQKEKNTNLLHKKKEERDSNFINLKYPRSTLNGTSFPLVVGVELVFLQFMGSFEISPFESNSWFSPIKIDLYILLHKLDS